MSEIIEYFSLNYHRREEQWNYHFCILQFYFVTDAFVVTTTPRSYTHIFLSFILSNQNRVTTHKGSAVVTTNICIYLHFSMKLFCYQILHFIFVISDFRSHMKVWNNLWDHAIYYSNILYYKYVNFFKFGKIVNLGRRNSDEKNIIRILRNSFP